jgi:phage gp29-like protein
VSGLVDQWGQPLRRDVMTREIGGAGGSAGTIGVRSPIASYPADGMTPQRLAALLRSAAEGEPLEYFELAELIEERDLHYAGVLQTRKRSVSQIDITVEAASDDPEDVRRADRVREWLKRDELQDEIFDMLDAIGKGVSFTEIIWDTSSGQWQPQRLEWRDQRWFTFDRITLRQPMLRGGIDGGAVAEPLPAFKFITTQIKAKSGLPIRSGIARLASWSWMFKAFTQRDWAIFVQTYGQPVRLGKFHEGATKEDKATLYRAVANIAGDCAAIIPQSMEIEFVEAKNVTAGSDLYEKRADWLDRQVSKAVLGQTTTTDAVSGGHAVAQEHRQVQEDIETADCKSISAVINRDLIRPWMDLEYGPGRGYPRLIIGRPAKEDIKQLTDSLAQLVPLGLRVQASEVRDKLGLAEPAPGSEILTPAPQTAPTAPGQPAAPVPAAPPAPAAVALQAQVPDTPPHPAEQIAARLADEAVPVVEQMASSIEAMLGHATDLGEFRQMLMSAYPTLDTAKLGDVIAAGLAAAQAAGRSDLEDESA